MPINCDDGSFVIALSLFAAFASLFIDDRPHTKKGEDEQEKNSGCRSFDLTPPVAMLTRVKNSMIQTRMKVIPV